jgi:FMN-dependent NADH-azoreductase
MDHDILQAYYKRNYEGIKITPEESALLQPFDFYRDQLMNNDILVISTPLYNFGMPAPVKAWLDAVMQRGYVYTTDENGHVPLLQHLKVCLIYTAGLVYDQINENERWNGLVAEGAELFEYMGARCVRRIGLTGVDMLPEENVKYRTENYMKKRLNKIAMDWYGVEQELDTELF